MATLNLNDVYRIAGRSRPWTIRLEMVDPSTNTNKFWYATGRAEDESVECGWGRIGNKPQLQLVDFPTFKNRVRDKLGKGYEYANTGYIRMSDESLSKLGGATPSTSAQSNSQPVTAPAAPQPTQSFTPPPMGQAKPNLPPLTFPYDQITVLRPVKGGFEALDEYGDVLLDLTASGGQDLVQNYGIPVAL